MSSFLVQDFVHLVAAVVFAGYALFWLVMSFAIRSEGGDLESGETLSLIGRSRWPPVAVPKALRVPIVGLGWILVLFMLASGFLLLHARGIGSRQLASGAFWSQRVGLVIAAKTILLALFAVVHARLSTRPSARAALLGAIVVGVIVCASALL